MGKNPHGRLLLAPRTGKTKLVIDLIKRDKPSSVLWVSPSLELVKNGIKQEFTKWNANSFLSSLYTSTYSSLSKVTGRYELIILDEEQHITQNNCKNLLNGSIVFRNICSLTGSPSKNQEKQDIYTRLNLKVLCNLNVNKAVDSGYLADYKIKVVFISMNKEKNILIKYKAGSFYTSEYDRYKWVTKLIESNPPGVKWKILERMRMIKESPSKLDIAKNLLSKLTGRILGFCSNIKQCEQLYKYRYHSKTKTKDLEDFQAGKINRIGMVNAGGTGFTYKNIDHLIITQVDSNKNGSTTQKICRTLLRQSDYKAKVWILCLKGTQDEKWLESTLESFNKDKITYYDN